MSFPNSQLDDDIVKFLNDNVIINDVEWDGKVLEINESDLSQIHSECSSARTTPHVQTPASDSKEAWIGGIEDHIYKLQTTPIRMNVIQKRKPSPSRGNHPSSNGSNQNPHARDKSPVLKLRKLNEKRPSITSLFDQQGLSTSFDARRDKHFQSHPGLPSTQLDPPASSQHRRMSLGNFFSGGGGTLDPSPTSNPAQSTGGWSAITSSTTATTTVPSQDTTREKEHVLNYLKERSCNEQTMMTPSPFPAGTPFDFKRIPLPDRSLGPIAKPLDYVRKSPLKHESLEPANGAIQRRHDRPASSTLLALRNELTTKSKIKIEPPELMVDTNITTAANSTNATTTPSNKNQTQQQQCVTGKPLTGKSQQTIIYEHQKEVSQYIPSKMQPKIFVSNEALEQMRARAIDTRTMMTLTGDEVEHLILNNLVQPVLNRKNDIGLEFPCSFCNWYNAHYNVPIRSFSRKEEIKRHHMLHLNYDRHTCQLCDYKCVRADHLRRHMRNKHPMVNYDHKTRKITTKSV